MIRGDFDYNQEYLRTFLPPSDLFKTSKVISCSLLPSQIPPRRPQSPDEVTPLRPKEIKIGVTNGYADVVPGTEIDSLNMLANRLGVNGNFPYNIYMAD